MANALKIEVITLGSELLNGLTVNGHLSFLGQELARRGHAIFRNVVIDDEPDTIRKQFEESWGDADIIITTGGLGPTSDDRTKEVIAEVLGLDMELDKESETAIRTRFMRLDRPMTSNNLKQAYKPRGFEVMPNANGTAPGLFYQSNGKLLFLLPGPPSEMNPMVHEQVMPRLEDLGFLQARPCYIQLRTAGIGESALAEQVEAFLEDHSGISVAYCAREGLVDVRLGSPGGARSYEELEEIAMQCARILGEDFVGFGDISLPRLIFERLRQTEQTLSVAESCTGGLLSSCFTDIPGVSKVFAGGIVCYSNDAKVQMLGVPECLLRQHGAVSAEAAIAMATGAAERLSTEYSLSVTGFAGPGGGDDDNPVGTIYMGLHTPDGIWCRRVNYPGSRSAVTKRAVNAALDWLRRELLEQAVLPESVPGRR